VEFEVSEVLASFTFKSELLDLLAKSWKPRALVSLVDSVRLTPAARAFERNMALAGITWLLVVPPLPSGRSQSSRAVAVPLFSYMSNCTQTTSPLVRLTADVLPVFEPSDQLEMVASAVPLLSLRLTVSLWPSSLEVRKV